MLTRIWLCGLCGCFLVGACRQEGALPARSGQAVISEYKEFLPQVLTWELVGYSWYQWDPCGHEEDENYPYNIKVVIFRGMSRTEAEARYPTVKGEVDYRYVEWDRAVSFLREKINWIKQEIPEEKQTVARFESILARLDKD